MAATRWRRTCSATASESWGIPRSDPTHVTPEALGCLHLGHQGLPEYTRHPHRHDQSHTANVGRGVGGRKVAGLGASALCKSNSSSSLLRRTCAFFLRPFGMVVLVMCQASSWKFVLRRSSAAGLNGGPPTLIHIAPRTTKTPAADRRAQCTNQIAPYPIESNDYTINRLMMRECETDTWTTIAR